MLLWRRLLLRRLLLLLLPLHKDAEKIKLRLLIQYFELQGSILGLQLIQNITYLLRFLAFLLPVFIGSKLVARTLLQLLVLRPP